MVRPPKPTPTTFSGGGWSPRETKNWARPNDATMISDLLEVDTCDRMMAGTVFLQPFQRNSQRSLTKRPNMSRHEKGQVEGGYEKRLLHDFMIPQLSDYVSEPTLTGCCCFRPHRWRDARAESMASLRTDASTAGSHWCLGTHCTIVGVLYFIINTITIITIISILVFKYSLYIFVLIPM